jgi:hypothetical protein
MRYVFWIALIVVFAAGTVVADTIELKNGDKLTGIVATQDNGDVVVTHPVLGSITVPADQIQVPEPAPVKPGLFGTSFMEGWSRSIGIAASGSNGDTSDFNIIASAKASGENEHFRHRIDSNYIYKSKQTRPDPALAKVREKTDNEAYVEAEEHWKLGESSLFVFSIGRYDYDEFEAWDHRVGANLGVGYDFINTDDFELRGSAGAGVKHSWKGEKETTPEGLLRAAAVVHLNKGLKLEAIQSYYPDVTDIAEFRLVTDVDLSDDVGEEGGLVLTAGLDNEYDTGSAGEKNDLKYSVGLGLEF